MSLSAHVPCRCGTRFPPRHQLRGLAGEGGGYRLADAVMGAFAGSREPETAISPRLNVCSPKLSSNP